MSQEPFFSVVITAYNQERFIERTLRSVREQTYRAYEVVVFDDGSTDHTAEKIRQVQDPRVQYFYQTNSGLPAIARNRGIEKSHGSFVAFLDGDDFWYPTKLERCWRTLQDHPHVDVLCHDEVVCDAAGTVIGQNSYGPLSPKMYRRLLFKGNCLSTSATVVRRSTLTGVGGFSEAPAYRAVEDYDLWMRLAKISQLYFLPEVLGAYTVHAQGISANLAKHRQAEAQLIRDHFSTLSSISWRDRLALRLRLLKTFRPLLFFYGSTGQWGKLMELLRDRKT